MPIDGKTLSPRDPIYTFVARDETNIHIHASRLRDWCLNRFAMRLLTPVYVPINRDLALGFLHDNIVSPERVRSLSGLALVEPIILCKTREFGKDHPTIPDNLLVDGHHRFTRHALDGMPDILAFWLEPFQWEPYEVVNLPPTTRARLNAEPILHKPYWNNK